ncbi:MAG: (5-formylfuran-3-yl)methyl phosphate synthase [Thiohalocapsa sp.]
MTGMLASVSNAAEAAIALRAGADLIDCKDPHRGALGALPNVAIKAIRQQVGTRCPVSATVGDLPSEAAALVPAVQRIAQTGVDYIKLGLFRTAGIDALLDALRPIGAEHRLIAVLFADRSPRLDVVPDLAAAGFSGVMLDTADKANGRLPDLMSAGQLADFVTLAHRHRLLCGLAGSLRVEDIEPLLGLAPDYVGFRGALCEQGRKSELSADACAQVSTAMSAAADDGVAPTGESVLPRRQKRRHEYCL